MTAREYRDALLRRWRFLILLALATGLGALLASQVMTHRYRSSALVEIAVNPANPTPAAVLQGGNLLATEVQLASSTPVLQRVTKNYAGLSDAQLASELEISAYNGTATIFQIGVLDASPARAASLANDVAAAVVAQQEQTREQQNTAQLQPLQDRLSSVEKDIEDTTATLAGLSTSPSDTATKARLQAHLADLNAQQSQLQSNISQIQVAQGLNGFTLRVAQAARQDAKPVRPVVWANVGIGVIFGLIVGMLLVLLRGLLALRMPASEYDAASFGWPYLTTLMPTPAAGGDGRAANTSQAYQQIETALRLGDMTKPIHSLVIASLGADESTQRVAAQLALQLAASGDRTLLVDANVERPILASWFGIAQQPGLSDAVIAFQTRGQSEQAIASMIQSPTTPAAPNLRIMSASGPWPNPMRVFRSAAMGRLSAALVASGAQRVFYSAPPLLHFGAARALATRADGMLLVIDPEHVRRDKLQRANSLLAQEGIRVLGYVLTRDPDQPSVRPAANTLANSEAPATIPPAEAVRTRHVQA
jgi:Mrp family chromosome partitioning ATPase/capsular polysaccharide biosynthesis protein